MSHRQSAQIVAAQRKSPNLWKRSKTQAENEQLRSERDELKEEVEWLTSELESLLGGRRWRPALLPTLTPVEVIETTPTDNPDEEVKPLHLERMGRSSGRV